MSRVFWVTVVDAENGEDLPAVKHPKHGLVIPSRPGKCFAVRAILEPKAWDLHEYAWYAVKLFIDGAKAGMRMIQLPYGNPQRMEWTFDNWRDGTAFQFAMRNDGEDEFDSARDADCGLIKVEFHPAQAKHPDELHASQTRRSWQKEENLKVARRINMAGGPKQTNSVLRTVRGKQVRQISSRPSGRPAPARLLDNITLGSISLSYDTPQNLEFRGILNPLKNREHRKFFPDKTKHDWKELRRNIAKNQFRSEQRRLTCDLTETGNSATWKVARNIKEEEGGGTTTSGFTDVSTVRSSVMNGSDGVSSSQGGRPRKRRKVEGDRPIVLDEGESDEDDYPVGD